jgi:glycosyltransferase involved in cell wall biosynthesis
VKIGLDAKRAFGNATGLGNYARWLIRGLVLHYPQHQFYLFTPTLNNDFEHEVATWPNCTIISPHGPSKLFKKMWRTYAIAALCNELQLDVYHGLSNELPVGIENFAGKKLVTIHDLIFLRYPHYYSNIDRYIYKKKFTYAAKHANWLIATSKQTSSDLSDILGISEDKIRVVYQNCSDTFGPQAMTKPLPEWAVKPYMVCVGTIEPRKRQKQLVKAFAKANIPQMHLYIIGRSTSYANEVETEIVKNGLQHRVSILNNVNTSELPAMYAHSKAAIYLSEFEGFGIPLLEAMRCNAPLIAANTSSLPEVAGDAALYANIDDTHTLATHIASLANDPDVANKLKQAAAIQAHTFDNNVLLANVMALYRH